MPVGLKPQTHLTDVIGDALHRGVRWADNHPRRAFVIILLTISILCVLIGGSTSATLTRATGEHNENAMLSPAKPFRQPWKLVERDESFTIVDASNTALGVVYFEDEPGRRTTMRRLSREDARRFGSQVAKLPELLDELKRHRAARDAPA